jgi:outer membrane protein assembly factor BamC
MKSTAVILSAILAALLFAGCSSVSERNKIDYKSAKRLPPLDVPPDLVTPRSSERYVVADQNGATYSDYSRTRESARGNAQEAVLPQQVDMRVERTGDFRWLVVNMEPEAIWQPLREFWQETGFLIAIDNPTMGLIETDWAENLAKVNESWFGRTFGGLDIVYSLDERDKFRSRVERGDKPGTSEIYISHQGLYQQQQQQNSTNLKKAYWAVRPRDPELEAEMLYRLMAKLGGTEAQIEQAREVPEPAPRAALASGEGDLEYLELRDAFDKAWRRVGLALDYVGFTVEDRNRSEGVYFVRYNDPDASVEAKGLSKLAFWRSDEPVNQKYRIRVTGVGEASSQVHVLDENGVVLATPTASRILALLRDQLK